MEEDECCPASLPELKRLDVLLQCGICYELMETPVMTSCCHTFCSLCVRKSLSYKQICPTCSKDVRETDLRKNVIVEDFITVFSALKKRIFKLLQNGVHEESTQKRDTSSTTPDRLQVKSSPVSKHLPSRGAVPASEDSCDLKTSAVRTPVTKAKVRTPVSKAKVKQSPSLKNPCNKITVLSSDDDSDFEPNNIKASMTSAREADSQSQMEASTLKTSTTTNVPCPVCSKNMPEREINGHLDLCLTGGRDTRSNSGSNLSAASPSVKQHSSASSSIRQHSAASPSTRQQPAASTSKSKFFKSTEKDLNVPQEPLKKMVYNLLSDSKLKSCLRDHGLSVQGDRYALQRRLQRYVVIYNAECDSSNPRTILELKQQLEKEEKAVNMPVATSSLTQLFKTVKQPNERQVEEVRKDYLQKNRSSYDILIQQARRGQGKKIKRKAQCLESDSEDDTSDKDFEAKSSSGKKESTEICLDMLNSESRMNNSTDHVLTRGIHNQTRNNIVSDDSDSSPSLVCIDDNEDQPKQKNQPNSSSGDHSPSLIKQSDVDGSDTDEHFEPSPVLPSRKPELKEPPSRPTRKRKKVNDTSLNTRPRTRRQSQLDSIPPNSAPGRGSQSKGYGKSDTNISKLNKELNTSAVHLHSRSPTPDPFEETPPSSGDIPPGQRTMDEEESNELSQLVSLMEGSSTDFED